MNKIQLTINIVLVAAVAALFIIFFTCKPASCGVQPTTTADGQVIAGQQLPIAYLNLDSLLLNYTFAVEANDRLMTKQEDARLKLNTRAQKLQNDMADFQRKLETNSFMSRERAEQAQQKLIKEQQALQEMEAKLTQDIMNETQKLNIQLRDTLDSYLIELNKDGKYQIIFANTASDNVLLAQPGYDITSEVIEALNARYGK